MTARQRDPKKLEFEPVSLDFYEKKPAKTMAEIEANMWKNNIKQGPR